MRFSRQFIAALVLLACVLAGAHIVVDHGSEMLGAHAGYAVCGEHHRHDVPIDDGEHRHHDVGAALPAHFSKSLVQQPTAPKWIPLCERLLAEFAAAPYFQNAEREHSVTGDSPPDARMSGWLFVAQTARPVRGPSLVA